MITIKGFDALPEIDPYKNDGTLTTTRMDIFPETEACAVYQHRPGDGITMLSWLGRVIGVELYNEAGEQPDPDELRAFLESAEGQKAMLAVCEGYETYWNGSNIVGRLLHAGCVAQAELEVAIADLPRDEIETWTCEDWFYGNEPSFVGIDSTREDISRAADEARDTARSQRQRFADDVEEYLVRYVAHLRE